MIEDTSDFSENYYLITIINKNGSVILLLTRIYLKLLINIKINIRVILIRLYITEKNFLEKNILSMSKIDKIQC